MPVIRGRVWVFGDDVNTDVIMPGKYLTVRDPVLLAPHVMEGIDPEFTRKARPGDLVVAGKNFGCGSSRETAPAALRTFGLSAVVAVSFARIFLRNAVNIGLPVFECPAAVAGASPGDELEIDPASGRVRNLDRGTLYQATAVPPFMRELIDRGGLVPYTRARLGLD
jgi:3-isopropylmalate/(R)-2-methylmalate dehydratase small subunit